MEGAQNNNTMAKKVIKNEMQMQKFNYEIVCNVGSYQSIRIGGEWSVTDTPTSEQVIAIDSELRQKVAEVVESRKAAAQPQPQPSQPENKKFNGEIVLNNAKNLLNELKGYGLDLIAASGYIENLLDEFEFLINQRQSTNTLDYTHYKEAVNVLVDVGLMSANVVNAIGTDEDAYIPAINILSIGPLKKVYIYMGMLLQKLVNDEESRWLQSILYNCIYILEKGPNENVIEESWKKLTNS